MFSFVHCLCTAGAVDQDGVPVKKHTEWISNSITLLKPLSKYVCSKDHEHGHPTGKWLERLKHYPPKICWAVVQGIINLKAERYVLYDILHSYPTDSTTVTDELPSVCPACGKNVWKHSPRHTRVGDCRYKNVRS